MYSLVFIPLLLVTALCLNSAYSQLGIAVTDPPTSDESPAVIAAPENATNVTLYCVTTVGEEIIQIRWRITRPGDTMGTEIRFNVTDGTGRTGFENYFVTSNNITINNVPIRTNLTIRVFDDSFDMATISCGTANGAAINGTFILRIIGKRIMCPH